VDDEPHIGLLVRPLLADEGIDVLAVRTLAEARAALARAPLPDALLLDLHLPDGTGLDLLTALRAAPGTRALPVLVLTAEGDERVHAAVRRAGAGIETKPFSPTKLARRLKDLVGVEPSR
jgi:DNA-binding response OmpR family regulator